MSKVRDFILTVVKVKHCSECSQRFPFNNREVRQRRNMSVVSEEKQRSERSQIFHFNSSEIKQHSECSQIFHFNSSEVKQRSECSQ